MSDLACNHGEVHAFIEIRPEPRLVEVQF